MAGDDTCSGPQLRRALDAIFPPRELEARATRSERGLCNLLSLNQYHLEHPPGSIYLEASSEPASRLGLTRLAGALSESLRVHRAKPNGLCPVRRHIFDQLFDELIRQATVACVDQGLLLVRVRDELRASLRAHERAYQSALEFGLRKALAAEEAADASTRPELREGAGQAAAEESSPAPPPPPPPPMEEEATQQVAAFYEEELAKRDRVIEQQRSIIRALSRELAATPNREPPPTGSEPSAPL